MNKYQTVIGLELHCELKTNSKVFSPSANFYSTVPNSNVNEIDMSFPGIMPSLNKEAARLIRKVLTSAVANAENNLKLDKNNLYVKEAYINEGQTMKRARMGSRGHVDPIKKRTSHITIVVSEKN